MQRPSAGFRSMRHQVPSNAPSGADQRAVRCRSVRRRALINGRVLIRIDDLRSSTRQRLHPNPFDLDVRERRLLCHSQLL